MTALKCKPTVTITARLALGILAATISLASGDALADLEQVEDHYLFNEYEEAIKLLEELTAADPRAAAASLNHQIWLARCLVQTGRSDEAVEVFCLVQYLDSDWQPDPVLVPENEREVFARAVVECLHGPAKLSIVTEPAGARVWLDGQLLSDVTPILDLQREAGRVDLILRLEGYREFSDRIDVRRPRTVIERSLQPLPPSRLTPPHADITRAGAVTRSMLIPGMGQFYKEQPTRGAIALGAATVTAGMAVWGHLQRNSRLDDMDRARDDYMAAVAPSELARTYAIYQDRADAVRRSENLRDIGLYAFAGVYVLNVIDAALGFPLGQKNVSVSTESLDFGEARLAISIAGR